jgi:hypothetical protein
VPFGGLAPADNCGAVEKIGIAPAKALQTDPAIGGVTGQRAGAIRDQPFVFRCAGFKLRFFLDNDDSVNGFQAESRPDLEGPLSCLTLAMRSFLEVLVFSRRQLRSRLPRNGPRRCHVHVAL